MRRRSLERGIGYKGLGYGGEESFNRVVINKASMLQGEESYGAAVDNV